LMRGVAPACDQAVGVNAAAKPDGFIYRADRRGPTKTPEIQGIASRSAGDASLAIFTASWASSVKSRMCK